VHLGHMLRVLMTKKKKKMCVCMYCVRLIRPNFIVPAVRGYNYRLRNCLHAIVASSVMVLCALFSGVVAICIVLRETDTKLAVTVMCTVRSRFV